MAVFWPTSTAASLYSRKTANLVKRQRKTLRRLPLSGRDLLNQLNRRFVPLDEEKHDEEWSHAQLACSTHYRPDTYHCWRRAVLSGRQRAIFFHDCSRRIDPDGRAGDLFPRHALHRFAILGHGPGHALPSPAVARPVCLALPSRLAARRILLTGILAYFLYYGASLGLGTAYNRLFLVYIALFSASFYAFILAFTAFDLDSLAEQSHRACLIAAWRSS